MTIDERINKLVEFNEKTQITLAEMLEMSVKALDSIKRLERIALANTVNIDDLDARLTMLEAKLAAWKPQ
jgi:hypothetical protein